MSRNDGRSRSLRRRPSRTVAASIVAVVITAIGALAAIAAIFALTRGGWPTAVTGPARAVAGSSWGSAAVIAAGAVIAVLGLIMLIAGIKPGRHKTAVLRAPGQTTVPDTEFVLSSRAIARLAASRADGIDGVESVSASADPKTVRVSVTTSSEQSAAIRQRVQQEVTSVLEAAGLQPVPRVRATVHVKGI
ncbi:copper chaperone CopZ [Friedmanniella endophytica]|uniref:Copper chaperone CopZ n=1 Tax=Microlunatus kandeliicorticis TaxID=1759536 RepID=A0A7W3IVV4_9ACTN|nr:DUF6286 domain-containing protein [Microlunatus kandeliicorticis]MBA8796238.1 copper chaperone CopZ [Microlunatus kandeliicorticis]